MPRTASAQRRWLAADNGTPHPSLGDLIFWDSYLGHPS
jgi:hypothetical protein